MTKKNVYIFFHSFHAIFMTSEIAQRLHKKYSNTVGLRLIASGSKKLFPRRFSSQANNVHVQSYWVWFNKKFSDFSQREKLSYFVITFH